ncbi:metal ABC transporter solute-binding protein, Zn/Mn family [Aquibacillus kalidii]|uniref:metal ABC transporter solute-binding protein, Zn/Mn family n=1 Tax=Aquibacillus kalidii TaxID=2762597 RepID=UPI002E2DD23D|nr:zinc ABC transporter substrate-binding protein [Aquibacillus kalidii]
MKKNARFLVLILMSIFILSACGTDNKATSSEGNEEKGALNIYTTLYPLEYFTKQIGGDYVEVSSILPPGTDAHTFEPTSKTVLEIAEADLFIYNNVDMEAYAETIIDALKDDVTAVEASAGISLLQGEHEHDHNGTTEEAEHEHDSEEGHSEETHTEEEHSEEAHMEEEGHSEEAHTEEEHNHGEADPHVWLDPIRAISVAENIKNTLIEMKPEAKQDFEANFADLKTKLEKLDEDFHNQLESKERNEILVTHAAYGYWEEAYGLEQISISGLSSTNEPSQKQLEEVIQTVEELEIHYLLFEQNVTPKVAKVIQSETKVESLQIHNLAVLTEEDIDADEDYFTLMNKNLEVLLTALEN